MKFERQWREPYREWYLVLLGSCPFVTRHDGRVEFWGGGVYSTREQAQRDADKKNNEYRARGKTVEEYFVVAVSRRCAGGWILSGTIQL